MHKSTKKDEKLLEKRLKRVKITFQVILCLAFLAFLRWIVFDIYKPAEKNFIKKSMNTYLMIQDELAVLYKEKGYIYKKLDDKQDEFCEILKRKYGTIDSDCSLGNDIEKPSIELKKGKVTIHGFGNPAQIVNGDVVKDLFIDVNGLKGENKFGIDRAPVRIYSNGRMGGMITPINCNKLDYDELEVPYSNICPKDITINFMGTKVPFSYNVMQLGGGKKSRTQILNKRVPFLRADCVAFGGDMIGATLYCEAKRYYWLTACYHEFPCAIGMGREDKITPNQKYLERENIDE